MSTILLPGEIGILELMAKRKQDKEDGKPVKVTVQQKKSAVGALLYKGFIKADVA